LSRHENNRIESPIICIQKMIIFKYCLLLEWRKKICVLAVKKQQKLK